MSIQEGSKVICQADSIDRNVGQGQNGVVKNFARFSSHHAREAMVKLEDGSSHWFWVRDLQTACPEFKPGAPW